MNLKKILTHVDEVAGANFALRDRLLRVVVVELGRLAELALARAGVPPLPSTERPFPFPIERLRDLRHHVSKHMESTR